MANELTEVSKAYISEGRNWDEDRTKGLRDKNRLGWLLAIVFGVLFVLATVAGFVVWMKMSAPVVPDILAIDKASGDVQVLETFGEKALNNMTAVHKEWAARYVDICERYIPEQINNDFAACKEMSEGGRLDKYAAIFSGPDARHLKLLNSQTWTIDVLGVQLPQDAAGVAIVRFKKTIWTNGTAAAEGFFTARLTYRFADIPKGTERQKISNPLSYKVRYYSADSDISSSQTTGGVPAMVSPAK